MTNVTPIKEYLHLQDLPPPALTDTHIRSLALIIYETLVGNRRVEQLGSWALPGAVSQLSLQRTLRMERDALYPPLKRVTPIPGRVTSSRTHDRKSFAVVVMHEEHRSFPISISLEYIHRMWRASEIFIL